MIERARQSLHRLLRDRRGVAAIEFAIIAPILLSLYFVTMEVAQGIEVNKKVGRVGSMVADLVTQQQKVTRSEVEAILKIGEAILQPYNRTRPTIIVTAVQMSDTATPEARVAWSRKLADGSFSVGAKKDTLADVPSQLRIRNTFLIKVESQLGYTPVITWTAGQKEALGLLAAFDGISMNEVYYLRPRMSQAIGCADC
ncbi:MAG TPA: TadE/TadG family type IV pilus assembly protein [Rhizobiaceae bacterium]|nr:TadE/TadG family type IV pilus assembly protein [Rhizobiaceae bacterium]